MEERKLRRDRRLRFAHPKYLLFTQPLGTGHLLSKGAYKNFCAGKVSQNPLSHTKTSWTRKVLLSVGIQHLSPILGMRT